MNINQRNKQTALSLWAALDSDPASAVEMLARVEHWQGFEPVGVQRSGQSIVDAMFAPFQAAMSGLKREIHIFTAGVSHASEAGTGDGAYWAAGSGYYTGRAVAPVFGIPATDTDLRIRWGEFLRFDAQGNVTHAQTIWDLVDWLDQIGQPVLPRPFGAAHVFPPATGYDAVLTDPQDQGETDVSLALGRGLIFGGLNSFDQSDLKSMVIADYFHPNLKWYGPGGIGACLSLRDFEVFHQAPWLVAFPDRKVMHLESLFAEGRIVAASGPMGVVAHHRGPYLGHPASGNRVEVSGLDFWLRTDGQFTENWVFVDVTHLFAQMGVDLLARVKPR